MQDGGQQCDYLHEEITSTSINQSTFSHHQWYCRCEAPLCYRRPQWLVILLILEILLGDSTGYYTKNNRSILPIRRTNISPHLRHFLKIIFVFARWDMWSFPEVVVRFGWLLTPKGDVQSSRPWHSGFGYPILQEQYVCCFKGMLKETHEKKNQQIEIYMSTHVAFFCWDMIRISGIIYINH